MPRLLDAHSRPRDDPVAPVDYRSGNAGGGGETDLQVPDSLAGRESDRLPLRGCGVGVVEERRIAYLLRVKTIDARLEMRETKMAGRVRDGGALPGALRVCVVQLDVHLRQRPSRCAVDCAPLKRAKCRIAARRISYRPLPGRTQRRTNRKGDSCYEAAEKQPGSHRFTSPSTHTVAPIVISNNRF